MHQWRGRIWDDNIYFLRKHAQKCSKSIQPGVHVTAIRKSTSSSNSPQYSTVVAASTGGGGEPPPPVAAESRFPSLPHYVLSRRCDHLPWPAARDEAAIALAMLAVISSAASPSSSSSGAAAAAKLLTAHSSSSSSKSKGVLGFASLGAFRHYDPAVFTAKSHDAGDGGGRGSVIDGQKMIKMMIELPRRMSSTVEAGRPATSVHQLNHMMSERKRRERVSESFDAPRELLPQGSKKKDKASVLADTKNYLKSLKVRVHELEERNRFLESRLKLQPRQDDNYSCEEIGESKERVQVHIGRASESTSETLKIKLAVIVREEQGYCNVIDVLLGVFESLGRKGNATLVSAEGRATTTSLQTNVHRTVASIITLQVKTGDYDEESFKAAVIDAVNDALARSANPSVIYI